MKRAFKLLFVFIAASLCVLSATFCGCSAKAEVVEGSFQITSVYDYSIQFLTDVGYEFKLSADENGYYNVKFRADYGNNKSYTFEKNVIVKEAGDTTVQGSFMLDGVKGLKRSDIKVSVLSVSFKYGYEDDLTYYAIALAFGVAALGALAAGITLFVLGNKKKCDKISATVDNAEARGEEVKTQTPVDRQEED